MNEKLKEFTNFIKQDFDIVKDYKNASKELTHKEALDKFLNEEIDNKIYLKDIHIEAGEILIKSLDKLETLEKRDTPMKVIDKAYDSVCPNCNEGDSAIRYDGLSCGKYNYCSHCGQKLDWNV